MAKHDKKAMSLRVYEYVDQDGVVFWSLTRLPGRSIRRVTLSDTRGTYYRTFITDLMQLATASSILKQED